MVSLPSSATISFTPYSSPTSNRTFFHDSSVSQPKSSWDVWTPSDSMSFRVALCFQWVTLHARLRGNNLADSLTKTGATFSSIEVPSLLVPVIVKLGHTCYSIWRRNLAHKYIFCHIPSVSSEELALFPVSFAMNCPDFAATVTAFFCPLINAG